MLESWAPVGLFFIVVAGFGIVSLIVSYVLGVKNPNPIKLAPYECGMNPVGTARERFLFPWAVVYRDLKLLGFVEMLLFILAIGAGFVYVWKKGALEWER
jgi:NADH-quinone oxidoreductase subunit A